MFTEHGAKRVSDLADGRVGFNGVDNGRHQIAVCRGSRDDRIERLAPTAAVSGLPDLGDPLPLAFLDVRFDAECRYRRPGCRVRKPSHTYDGLLP